jgi:hypothetical protein
MFRFQSFAGIRLLSWLQDNFTDSDFALDPLMSARNDLHLANAFSYILMSPIWAAVGGGVEIPPEIIPPQPDPGNTGGGKR